MKKQTLFIVVPGVLALMGYLAYGHYEGTRFRYTGTLEADETDLSPGVASRIGEVLVREGDLVKAGQALVRLDCEQERLNAANAQNDFNRIAGLYAAGSGSKANYDHLQFLARNAALQVSWCDLSSPIDAVVSSVYHRKGEWVRPGMNVITVYDIHHPYAYIYVPFGVRGRLSLGMDAEGVLDGDEKRPYKGRIIFLRPEAEYTPKNVQTREERERLVFGVKVAFDNPDGRLTPGMPVDVRIEGVQ